MKKAAITLMAALTIGCVVPPGAEPAWRSHVTPKSDGQYSVTMPGHSAESAKSAALSTARAACDSEGGKLTVTQEKETYNEASKTEKIGTAAAIVGAALYVKNTNRAAYYKAPERYSHQLEFRCS